MLYVQVSVRYKKKSRHYTLQGSAKRISKALAQHQSKVPVIRALICSSDTKLKTLDIISLDIHREVKDLCADSYCSHIRDPLQSAMDSFTWDHLWSELKEKAPLTCTVFQEFLPAKHPVDETVKPVLCMCLAIIWKRRNPNMCMVQCLISLCLYAGNAGTHVNGHLLY